MAILQYNCRNANHRSARPFFDRLDPEKHHIVAVQEPYYTARTKSTYCPPGYYLAYRPDATTRVCFMVSKALSVESWACQVEHADIAIVSLWTDCSLVDIINAYNPRPATPQSRTPTRLPVIKEAIQKSIDKGHEVMLLGDFNLHHPRWGGIHCTADTLANNLLNETEQQGLTLALPPGTITWRRGGQASTIDLAFVSTRLSQQIIECQPREEWAQMTDHIPIMLKIETSCPRTEPKAQFIVSKINTQNFRQAVELRLAGRQELCPREAGTTALPTEGEVDAAVSCVQAAILSALQEHCPKAKPSQYARQVWSETCSKLVRMHRAAWCRFATSHDEADEAQYKTLRNQLKRQL